MSKQGELVTQQPVAIEHAQDAPRSLLEVIANAVADPRMDVEKMSKLLDMHERITAAQRRTAYMAAMARLTPRLPQISQSGRIEVGGQLRSRYSKYEDIDAVIRPLIAEEGFSQSFDTQPVDGKLRVTCTLSHAEGHSETKQIDLPFDKSGSKNDVQSVGSTVSYGRRMLTKMFFNLVERGEDTDAENLKPITEEQAKDLLTLIDDVKADRKRFLEFMGAASVEGIFAKDMTKAVNALESKRRVGQK